MKIELYWPVNPAPVSQYFGGNANSFYKDNKLDGHPGIDFGAPWGNNIRGACESLVYKVFNYNNPDLSAYRAICTLVVDGDEAIEYSYGHCDKIFVKAGDIINIGRIIGTVGNTGGVYSNGVEVSVAEKNAGSHAGAHLHFQERPCKRVLKPTENAVCLLGQDGQRYKDSEGKYYEVLDYDNGFNGCTDPINKFNGQFASNYVPPIVTEKPPELPPIPAVLTPEKVQIQINAFQKLIDWIFDILKKRSQK